MIIGIGSDLVDIRRVEKIMQRYEDRFIRRCFSVEEREKAETRRPGGTHVAAYAKRFAAKEACAKALGTGFSGGILMMEIAVVNDNSGRPILRLSGAARERLDALVPEGAEPSIHLSITDEPPLAQAFVVIEAIRG